MSVVKDKIWPTAIVILLTLLVLRYILAPLFLETITKLRIRSVSFRSIKGIEWKGKGVGAPQIRIERVGWEKSKRNGAWFTIVVEGLTVKITKTGTGTEKGDVKEEAKLDGPEQHRAVSGRRHRRQFSLVGTEHITIASPSDIRTWLKARLRHRVLLMATLAVRQSPWLAHLVNLRFHDVEALYIGTDVPLLCKLQELTIGVQICLSTGPEEIGQLVETLGESSFPYSPSGLGSPSASPFSAGSSLPGSPYYEGTSPFAAPQVSPFGTRSTSPDGLLRPPGLGSVTRQRTPVAIGKRDASVARLKRTRLGKLMVRAMGRAAGCAEISLDVGSFSIVRLEDHRQWRGLTRSFRLQLGNANSSPVRRDSLPGDRLVVVEEGTDVALSFRFGRELYLTKNTIEIDVGVAPTSFWIIPLVTVLKDARPAESPVASGNKRLPEVDLHHRKQVATAIGNCKVRLAMVEATLDLSPRPSNGLPPTAKAQSGSIILRMTDVDMTRKAIAIAESSVLRDIFGTAVLPHDPDRALSVDLSSRYTALEYSAGPRTINASADGFFRIFSIDEARLSGVSTYIPGQPNELAKASVDELMSNVMQGSFDIGAVTLDLEDKIIESVLDACSRLPLRSAKPPSNPGPRLSSRLLPRLILKWNVGPLEARSGSLDSSALQPVIRCAGIEGGLTTAYREIAARGRDRASASRALKAEEAFVAESATRINERDIGSTDKRFSESAAWLQDDMSFAIDVSAHSHTETISLTAENRTSAPTLGKDERLFVLDAIDVKSNAACLGRGDGSNESRALHPVTLLGHLDVSAGRGVELHLMSSGTTQVMRSLLNLAHTLRSRSASGPTSSRPTNSNSHLLSRLPSGLSIHVCISNVILLLANKDPNPACTLELWRGLKASTRLSMQYCYYDDVTQTRRSRHVDFAMGRQKLGLEEGVSAQALALENHLRAEGGRAALFTIKGEGLQVAPIFNAKQERDVWFAPLRPPPDKALFPRRPRADSCVGWDFQRARVTDQPPSGTQNAIDPLLLSLQQEGRKPLLVCRPVSGKFYLRDRIGAQHPQLLWRLGPVSVNVTMAHCYCTMLAMQSLQDYSIRERLSEKPATPPAKPSSPGMMDLSLYIERLQISMALPLGERMFLATRNLNASKKDAEVRIEIDSAMAFVPSAFSPARWEEISRLKGVTARMSREDLPSGLHLQAEAVRLRVPFRYQVSKLILNINTAIKAFKLLRRDLTQPGFPLVRRPEPEGPKIIPGVSINVLRFAIDMKDDPLEAKLNLIWRVGQEEQLERLDRLSAFQAKACAIAEAQGLASAPPAMPGGHTRWRFDATHSVSVDEAHLRLMAFDARQWIARFNSALHEQNRREQVMVARVHGVRSDEFELPIDVLPPMRSAPLFRVVMDRLQITAKAPLWTREETLQHMDRLAGSYPLDTNFSLMVPMAIKITADSVDATLRDYPLPLLRVPPIDPSSRPHNAAGRAPAFSMETDIVVAEELPKKTSFVLLPCTILPRAMGHPDSECLQLSIAKSPMSTKTFAEPLFIISTPHPTDFTWGNAYQPAIQDLTKVFETFSHPPRDPSPKMGFWDKIRLNIHWRVTVAFENACHLHLKGSRDPYEITGRGAGFVWAWMGGVRMTIGLPNDQRETIQIRSDTMVLSIPDLTAFMDASATGTEEHEHPDGGKAPSELPSLLERRGSKTCARFANGVRVGFGFRFERSCRDHNCKDGCRGDPSERRCRMFDSKPHHQVVLRTREAYEGDMHRLGHVLDSYEGFRSDFIHFSMSLFTLGDGSEADLPSNIHLTPHGFAHLYSWWGLFNHAMSLPIRQGRLFPKAPPASKKFGRSLGTIKYRFDIAALYISHFYPQQHAMDWTTGMTTAVGVKARIGHFRADAHQREQEKVSRNDVLGKYITVKHKPFYAVEVYLDRVHLRSIIATFDDEDKLLLRPESHADRSHQPAVPQGVRVSALPGDDKRWFTFDDFVDIDQRPNDHDPHLVIHDLASCPQFHYSKWVAARRMSPKVMEEIRSGYLPRGVIEASKFGKEFTHDCLMREGDSAMGTHNKMFSERIKVLRERITALEDQRQAADHDGDSSDEVRRIRASLQTRIRILEQYMQDLVQKAEFIQYTIDLPSGEESDLDARQGMTPGEGAAFESVYHIHQPRISLNNESRNAVMRYYFSNRGRKGFEYHMSTAALSLLGQQLDQDLGRSKKESSLPSLPAPPFKQTMAEQVTEKSTNMLAQGLLKLLTPDHEPRPAFKESDEDTSVSTSLDGQIDPSNGLPDTYNISKSHFVYLIGPQISLASEVDSDSRVLLAASIATFRGFTVRDPDILSDDVNATVLHRNYASLAGLQGFYPTESGLSSGFHGLFVPLETAVDVKSELPDFDRIISRVDAKLRYDKFNQLRLKYNVRLMEQSHDTSAEHIENTQDLCIVDMPRFAVMANGRHYSALYNVITNLMLHQDPEHKKRVELLEAYAYAFDYRDSHKFVAEVARVQKWIRGLRDLLQGYNENYSGLSIEGKRELESIKQDSVTAAEKLSMLFDLVATAKSQGKNERADLLLSTRLEARAGEMAWFMLGDQGALIAKLAIKGIAFSWTRKKDSSTENVMIIQELQALNSDPSAHYTEMVSRFAKNSRNTSKKAPFLHADWSVLAPVGGITIIEHFGVHLHPVKIQLEKRVGKQIMDYVFNDRKARAFEEAETGRKSLEGRANRTVDPGDPIRNESSSLSAWKLRRSRSRNASMLSLSSKAERSTPVLSRQVSYSDLTGPTLDVPLTAVGDPVRRGSSDSVASTYHAFAEEKEMRARATTNRTFVAINVDSTSLILSYKGDKPRSLTDLHDLRFDTPTLRYENKTWSFETLVAQIRRDYIKAAWTQKGQLVKGLISRGKPQTPLQGPTHVGPAMVRQDTMPPGPSALRFSVQAPSPQEAERDAFPHAAVSPSDGLAEDDESSRSHNHGKRKMGRLWQKLVTSHPDGREPTSSAADEFGADDPSRMRSSGATGKRNGSRSSLARSISRQ